jgi:hypothetical protein
MEAVASRTVVDATGNHHDATCDLTLGACPLSTPYGRIENAYVLDGSNDLLRVESAPAFEQSSAFTITAWVFGDAGSVGGCIVNKGFGGADNSWQACIDSNGMLKFHSVGAGGFHTQTAGILTVERWYHVALWWNGSTKTTYVDGMVAATISNISIIFDHSPITIGGDIDDGKLVLPFKGRVDDVQIYDRALTGDELRALAAGGSPRG